MRDEGQNEEQEIGKDRDKTAQVYARLRAALLLQRIPPRTRLDMTLVSRKLDVSVTPVREALIKLEKEGIVKYQPGKGYSTVALNLSDLLADYDLALMITKYTIDKNVVAFSSEGLRSAVEDGGTDPIAFSGHYSGYIEALLERIAGLTGNHKFVRLMQGFNDRTSFIRQIDLQRPDRKPEIINDISELVRLLENHDADGAIANVERQVRAKSNLLYELVKEGNTRALDSVDEFDISL